MAQILLSTTGVLSNVIINDLGARLFAHPSSNVNLSDEYDLDEIISSIDLQTAIGNNYVTLTSDGNTISNLSDIMMFKSTYDADSDEIIDIAATASNAENLDGFSSSYYLDLSNATGILATGSQAVWVVNGQTGAVLLDTGDIAENGNLYFTNTRARNAVTGGTGISYNSTTGEFIVDESQIDHNSLLNYSINEHRTINDSGTSSTDLWSAAKIQSELVASISGVASVNGQTGSVTLDTDDIPEGVTNLYFTEQRARDVISIAAGSENYLGYSTASGELSISALAITDVTTDNAFTSSSAYFSANYTGSEFQEGDTVILTAIVGGSEVYMHNGGTAGTSIDFTAIETPHLDQATIRTYFSATTPLQYNNTTGDFSILQSGVAQDGYLSSTDWNTFNDKVDTVNGVTGPNVVINTDNVSEGSTNLYFTELRARESILAGTGIGYTSSNGVVYLDASIDNLNDVDTTTATASTGDYLQWDGSNWVPTTLGNVGKKTWHLQAGSSNNTTNRYLQSDGIYTNQTPLVSHYDAEITSISIASNGAETWTGIVYVDGVTAVSLSAAASAKELNNSVSGVTFSSGSEISIYCSGVAISNPRVEIILSEL